MRCSPDPCSGLRFLLAVLLTTSANFAAAQEEKPPAPEVKLVLPLTLVRDADIEATVRGVGLDQATVVRLAEFPAVEVEIKKKEKSGPPNNLRPEKVGDTELVIAFRLPAEAPETVSLMIETAGGEAKSLPIAVLSADAVFDEKEPNGGFRDAQPLAPGQTARGVIGQERDVDTFQFTTETGQTLSIEIQAAQLGSPLDPLVMLFDGRGYVLATSDDGPTGADPTLSLELPHAGDYYLAILDAHDAGSPLHRYLLTVRTAIP